MPDGWRVAVISRRGQRSARRPADAELEIAFLLSMLLFRCELTARGGWRVVACCYRGASTAPISTWRFCIDAVPDTVLGTHAGSVSRQSWRSSLWRSRFRLCRGCISAAVSVRRLADAGADL